MIGKILKYMRKMENITQNELAKNVNIPQNTISQYETGIRQPTFEIVEKIANNCGYNVDFVSDDDKVNSKNIDRKEL